MDSSRENIRRDNELLQELLEEHKTKIANLTKNLEETTSSLANYKALASKSEDCSKLSSTAGRLMESISLLQKESDTLKESKIVLQCENDYLKNRNKDLETYRQHMDRIALGKQQEIARLRD